MVSPSDPSPSDLSSSEPRSSATTSATPPTFYEAAHAVLNTNELLCEIIGRLPLEDIVATTGVCKTWRAALKASVEIQQALFLAPVDIRQITTDTEHFPERVENFPRGIHLVVGQVNPSLAGICGPVMSNDDFRDDAFISGFGAVSPRKSFEHPCGSWRDMFITQPPTAHVELCLYPIRACDFDVGLVELSHLYRWHKDIRMGQLYDFIELNAQVLQQEIAVRVVMPDFHPEHTPFQKYHDWCWEVRKGEVVRQILPHPGSELSKDELGDGVDS